MDVVLRGGQVLDGSGAQAFRADVGLQGGAIAAVGDLAQAQAARIIDVSGLVVAPGFIDMHSHSDLTLPVDPTADSKVRQGITTEVIGMCGIGPAPVTEANRGSLERFWSGVSADALDQSEIPWRSFGDYLAVLRAKGLLVNVVPLVGHGPLRSGVMGWRDGAPTAAELEAMQDLLARCLKEGAWGISTGLIYAPGIYASTEELISLAKVVAARGGFYFSHIRGEGETLFKATEEAIEIGRQAKLPVEIAHWKAAGRKHWDKAAAALALQDKAQAEGLDVTADIYPYVASSTSLQPMLMPNWAKGNDFFTKPLATEVRRRLAREVEAELESSGRRWDEIYIARCKDRLEYEGLTIAQVAEKVDRAPVEAALALLEETGGKVSAIQVGMSEENVQLGLAHPTTMIGTDGSALKATGPLGAGKLHPRSYGTFPRVLGRYVRELGLLSLEQAVHKMTGMPARKLRLRDRGRIAVGLKADITVFNPQTVIDIATFPDPYRYPTGIEYVLVNGQVVVDSGETANCLPGKVLAQ